MRSDPEKGAEFATMLANDEDGPLIDLDRVSEYDQHLPEHYRLFTHTCHTIGCRCLYVSEHDPASHFLPFGCS